MGNEASIDFGSRKQTKESESCVASKTALNPTNSVKIQETSKSSENVSSTKTLMKAEDEHISTFTEETEASKIDEPAASFPYRRMTFKQKKKRKCCRFCRRRHKTDQNNTSLLHSFSKGGQGAMSNSSEDDPLANSDSEDDVDCFEMEESQIQSINVKVRTANQSRRKVVPTRPDVSMSLWAVIKNAIGKDLTKLPLPVNFNEPLSMLQRLTEDFEYSYLIDKAAGTKNSCEQMSYIAAYTVSAYATSSVRTGKPFNPLLGETFECDRSEDLGWRCVSEQVSHHPPLAAQYCQGRKWTCWQQFSMSSKFRGNSIEISPMGLAHLMFNKTGVQYTWRKVPSIVHNIMIGKLWIDQDGEMDIYNHTTGDTCHIKYIPSSFFRGEAKRVEGTIYDAEQKAKIFISGYWDSKMEAFEILKMDNKERMSLGPPKLLWSRVMPPLDSDRYYNFTLLACQLNEMEVGVAPTDSRNRPDQRLMENGYFDEANEEKLRLEEKQRGMRKLKNVHCKTTSTYTSGTKPEENELGEPNHTPAWFSIQKDPVSGNLCHMFNGDYWKCKESQDWSRCLQLY